MYTVYVAKEKEQVGKENSLLYICSPKRRVNYVNLSLAIGFISVK